MESYDGYITSLLNQASADVVGSDNIVEADNEVTELPNEMNSQLIKRNRSKEF